ncbi:hypothetical protein YH64_013230 [Achromobacter sp. LC458]|nr:hypothetical protein YH64_013230 [Achromobacter sp. LC458]
MQALARQAVDLTHFAPHQAAGGGGGPAERFSQAHGLLACGGKSLTLTFPPDSQPTTSQPTTSPATTSQPTTSPTTIPPSIDLPPGRYRASPRGSARRLLRTRTSRRPTRAPAPAAPGWRASRSLPACARPGTRAWA